MQIHLADHSPERGQRLLLLQERWGGWLHSYAYAGHQGYEATLSYFEYMVRLHFADASTDRGQLRLRANEAGTNSLFSFAYKDSKHFYQPFEDYWDELVRIHLAGLPSASSVIQEKEEPPLESHLTTYADQHEVRAKEKAFDMRIHLTDTTGKLDGKQNPKTILSEEKKQEHLYSAAYPDQEALWAETSSQPTEMNIHLAGHTANPQMDKATKTATENHLTTYADQPEVNNTSDRVIDLRPRVIIDSGAFTAWTSGKPINPLDYGKWALSFEKKWRDKMASLEFMNLDVIGDQEASWNNQAILEKMGLKPIPIITYGAGFNHLTRALEGYDYLALGGLVSYSRNKDKLKSWLDACFSRIMAYKKKTGILRKVHLLGITTDWVLKRYPCYSSDSSSWVSCLRFGGGAAAGLKQLPRYKDSDAAMDATIHTLRAEIRKYKKMEQEATALWKKRGIEWND